jgi:hypothetical protein
MDLFSGYDQMLLGQTETEINEPTTQQNGEMPSPYESQAVEEETFETLRNGGAVEDNMGVGAEAPAPVMAPVMAQQPTRAGIPPALVLTLVAIGAIFLFSRK